MTPPADALAYKILTAEQWAAFERDGRFEGAPVDLADGFIHLSTAAQAAETAAKHFAGQDGLILAAIDLAPLGAAVRWEVSRGGALFPHVYGALTLEAVRWARPIPLVEGGHQLPLLDPALLVVLVCPVTRTALRHDATTGELVSDEAALAYPIRDGVPVLLIEEARRL